MGNALRQGLLKVARNPALCLGLWFMLAALAFVPAWTVKTSLADHIGASTVADRLRSGFDLGWYQEFREQARGLARTFGPTVTGPGPVLDAVEAWLQGDLIPPKNPGLARTFLVFVLAWTFMTGGVLYRFTTRESYHRAPEFFAAAARFFPRLLGLAALSFPLYFFCYRGFGRFLFRRVDVWTRNETHEWRVMLGHLGAFLLLGLLVMFVHLIFDYARIVTVAENRWNIFSALGRGCGFVLTHPFRTLGIALVLGGVWAGGSAVYAWANPGVGQDSTGKVLGVLLLGQAYIVFRVVVKLWLYGSEVGLYERIHPVHSRFR